MSSPRRLKGSKGRRRAGVRPRKFEAASPPTYRFRVEEVWIPMPDGVRLAANLFRPKGAKRGERFPVLLEYLPYRKDDGTVVRDYDVHGYFARRGYVTARVDIRGTGRSEGRTPDREYSDQEHEDGLEVIAWLARQPWSSKRVGMFGISWGGFNAIQLAMRRPPALKAILAIEATDDLFQDDIHYIDGLMHVDEYEISMDQHTSMTRAPDFPLDEDSLAARFDNPPWKLLWMRHPRDGPFWKRASLISRYDSIRIPVFLIAGWLDGYRDSVPRMLEHLRSPVKAIIGPWNHTFPHDAVPGPAIEWRHEAVRWWDHWLKDRDTGILDEPRLAVFVRYWYPPDPTLREIPGEWRSEEWPISRTRPLTMYPCGDHVLGRDPGALSVHSLEYIPSAGAEAGAWWGELLPDQGPLDRFSLVYDTDPLREDTEILGFPKALLRVSTNAPLAHWFARLSDVAPGGSVTLVTGAGRSGAHRASARNPKPLEPGREFPLEIELHFTSWVFPRGHRIRVAISNALWPMIWPTPYPMTTTLHVGGTRPSRIVIPVLPTAESVRPAFLRPEPVQAAPGVRSVGETWPGVWKTRRDERRKSTELEWSGETATEFPWGRRDHRERILYSVEDPQPDRASVTGEVETEIHLEGRTLTFRGVFELRSDVQNFYYRFRRELWTNDRLLRERSWVETIPRDYQ